MIPLLFIALAVGAVAAAYEFSPKAQAWTTDHVTAIRDAIAAHHEADAKIIETQAAAQAHVATQAQPDAWDGSGPVAPGTWDPQALVTHAWDSLKAAMQANAVAAAKTITALKTAKTDPQMVVATQSAVAVDARQKQLAAIAAELHSLGTGQCGVRTYHVTAQLKDVLLAKLHAEGMTVTPTGESQWDVAAEHGVKLRAVWDPQAQALTLIVTAGTIPLLITCDAIWGRLDPVMKSLGA